jgi:hypothetical protein
MTALKRVHDYVSPVPDDGGDHVWAGYPDESSRFISFADSLAGFVLDGRWSARPFTQKRLAIVVDFFSNTQAQAESSLTHGWNGASEFPLGVINTVRSRAETNEQNALIERHVTFIATGYPMHRFLKKMVEKLLDSRTCRLPLCTICAARWPRDLAMAIALFRGLGHSTVHLISRWKPSETLTTVLRSEGIVLSWTALDSIPSEELQVNRYYSIWDGTIKQRKDFKRRFWGP